MLTRAAPGSGGKAAERRDGRVGNCSGRGAEPAKQVWRQAGNYNSDLSALIWVSQLVIFAVACSKGAKAKGGSGGDGNDEDGDDTVATTLEAICDKTLRQHCETPLGYALRWRSYLFGVSRTTMATKQGLWSLDGESVLYRGVRLYMTDVTKLMRAEYQRAYSLLYDGLLFGIHELRRVQSWRLNDDLDDEAAGASWLDDRRNAELLEGADQALLQAIQDTPELRSMFVRDSTDGGGGGRAISQAAIDIYESQAQDFLGRLLLLCHVGPAPPVRAPELLSTRWRNTDRRRHVGIWEKLVMIHIQYHKGQQKSGRFRENVRFLPKAVGDLLLTYLAYVVPLRQIFLRTRAPGSILSPYLWATLDGKVWPDERLSKELKKACRRAEVPPLHTSNWRQFAATITKQKFSARERADFDVLGSDAIDGGPGGSGSGDEGDAGEDTDLVALAEMSNHTFITFNQAYAGTTTMTMTALLHRGYRASEKWRQLFRLDESLNSKRPYPGRDGRLPGDDELAGYRRRRLWRRPARPQAELLDVARRLENVPDLQFRAPGQLDAVLAMVGPRPAEQLVVVLGTGSGKTLPVMVGAALDGASTTILIVPMVALQADLLRRVRKCGLKPLVWASGCKQAPQLIVVSVEAACSEAFLEYCQRLVMAQRLDRIVIDECHLTITASDYRPVMLELGWYVRQVPTQTVWMTATLPPVMLEHFIQQNKLVRPTLVRDATNRPNILYRIKEHKSRQSHLLKSAEAWIRRRCEDGRTLADRPRDKMIAYCRTIDEAKELAQALDSPLYLAESGTAAEKEEIIASWLGSADTPVIVATSALGLGFDYPHVRLVVHINAPYRMTDFSQETGRAGRDGEPAESCILLPATWVVDYKKLGDGRTTADEAAMQLYISRQFCLRGALSQFLDLPEHRRRCTDGDICCQVCPSAHGEPWSPGMEFRLQGPAGEAVMEYTGAGEVLRQDREQQEALDRYEKDLAYLAGICVYCRVRGQTCQAREVRQCKRRWDWIRAKEEIQDKCKREGRPWLSDFTACFACYQPQQICANADPEVRKQSRIETTSCEFRDMVLPAAYGVYMRPGSDAWFWKHFQRRPGSRLEYMSWIAEKAVFNGIESIQAVVITAKALEEII